MCSTIISSFYKDIKKESGVYKLLYGGCEFQDYSSKFTHSYLHDIYKVLYKTINIPFVLKERILLSKVSSP